VAETFTLPTLSDLAASVSRGRLFVGSPTSSPVLEKPQLVLGRQLPAASTAPDSCGACSSWSRSPEHPPSRRCSRGGRRTR
jgi:hypothetical protein